MEYNRLCRAHDAIRPGTDYPLMKQIQAIMLLYQTDKFTFRLRPTNEQLAQKLKDCFHEAVRENRSHEVAQAYDVANLMNVRLEAAVLQQVAEEQFPDEIYGRHFIPRWQHFSISGREAKTLEDVAKDDVHNSKLNASVKQAVVELCKKYENINVNTTYREIVQLLQSRNYLSKKALCSLRHIESDTAHFNIGITLLKLFCCVGLWINAHPEREELLKRLFEELEDMSKTCSTGHMARLVNVVQGFSSDLALRVAVDGKKIVYDTMTSVLRTAPEEIVDGIIDQTEEYKAYVMNAIHPFLDEWNATYGKESVEEYINSYFSR